MGKWKDRAKAAEADLELIESDVGHVCYKGNSVSWWWSKAEAYRKDLREIWDALNEIGIHADGKTHAADAIRKFAVKK